MLRAIRSLILFFLSIAALIGIKALDLHVVLTIVSMVTVTIVALIGWRRGFFRQCFSAKQNTRACSTKPVLA